jgi:hypothetical protein
MGGGEIQRCRFDDDLPPYGFRVCLAGNLNGSDEMIHT